MEDTFGKYLRLFGTLFFTFIGFIIAFILLMLGIRGFFGLLSYIPWFTYVFMVLILMFPASLFISAYIIYFIKTKTHPSKIIRTISYSLFSVALLFWAYFFVSDLILFFRHFYNTIDMYSTYNLLFLAINVGCFFFIGVMQAFTTEKEKDWMERSVRD
jgi:hypothetical protein